ncbi:MAG: YfjI family protein [Planctomycetaceae bacterium]|nr:YfjI family protein [Planctomycetaceae bacterium]
MTYKLPPATNGHKPRAPTPAEMAVLSKVYDPHAAPGEMEAILAESHQQKPNNSRENTPSVDVDAQERTEWKPFPVMKLPQPIRGFVIAASKAIGCDPCFIGGPMLVACAAAVGNSRRVRLKRGWIEPCILWLALVGYSGEHKSPALELALRCLRELQRKKLRQFNEDHKRYLEVDLPAYEKAVNEWKRSKTTSAPPEKPEEPIAWRVLVDDATVEALAALLSVQPRGLLLAIDELAGWLGGFDKYRAKGAGGDASKWLEMFGGRTLLIDRKGGSPRTLCVPYASTSVVGGIQPEILSVCLTPQHRANGMSARLLVCWPPRRRKTWSEAEVHPDAEAAIAKMLARLFMLKMEPVEGDDPRPHLVDLDTEAKRIFIAFYNEHADEQSALSGEMCATWSKIEGYAPRLALVTHLVRWANGEIPPEREFRIDAESMQAGIELAQWFGNEARRVHGMFHETDDQRELRQLSEWIQARGGRTSVRDLMLHQFRYRKSADSARADLQKLVTAKQGKWESVETGGRPAEEFVLTCASTSTEATKPQDSGTCVDEGGHEIGERYLADDEMDQFSSF